MDPRSLAFTTLPWDGGERFAHPRSYLERLWRDAARLDIAWPQDMAQRLRTSLEVERLSCSSSTWPSPPGLVRIELSREGEVGSSFRALPAETASSWKAISQPAPWFGRCTGAKHGAWEAYREATASARQSGASVALLFRGELLVDGDRCTPLLRRHGEWLVPSEAGAVHSVSCSQLGLPLRRARLTRHELLDAEEVLVLGSGVGVRRLSHLDGRNLRSGDGYDLVLRLLEAQRDSRWCSLDETCAAASQPSQSSSWQVGDSDRVLPLVAEQLRRRHLWGDPAWAPDQLLFQSGGPVTDIAECSLLAGPPCLRFLARQPEGQPPPRECRPLQGQLPLLRDSERLSFTWQPEIWRLGWEPLKPLSEHQCLGPSLREVASSSQFCDSLWALPPEEADGLPVRGSALTGLLTYDMVQWTQPLALQHPPETGALVGALYRVDRWLIHQRPQGRLLLLAPAGDPWAYHVAQCLDELLKEPLLEPVDYVGPLASCSSRLNDEAHMEAVRQVQEGIREGQFYQVNFGRAWEGDLCQDPWQLMLKLFKQNAAPFAGFLRMEDLALCSCSPELLVSLKQGLVSTCPIKGTCGRSGDLVQDEQLRREMVASQKEVAEHLMLVDLERHDLGYACLPSVVWDRWRVETFPNIQHMVSKVSGRLRPSSDLWASLEAMFPGGSITGCPKTATVAAIDFLEKRPRRSWTGSLGFVDLATGEGQWNILIRTLEAEAREDGWHATVKAGGGLTIGSDPASEVVEAKLKADRLLKLAFSGGTEERRGPQMDTVEQFDVSDLGRGSVARVEALLKAFTAQQGASGPSGSWAFWTPRAPSKRVIFVDNLDSFSLNVSNSLAQLGAEVLVVPGRGPSSPEVEEILRARPSHVVLGPGPGRPEASPLTMALAELALSGRLHAPLLGICLGHQALGLAKGWRLGPSPLGPVHGVTEEIHHRGSGLFSKLESPARMMRYNSLVLEAPAATCALQVCAWDSTGQLPMALEYPGQVFGVQFHPESAGSYQGDELLKTFLYTHSKL